MSDQKKKNDVQWNATFEPLVNYLISSNKVKIRNAVEVGKKAVEYFRAADLVKWVLKNEETLRKTFPDCFEDPKNPLVAKDAHNLADEMCRLGFIYKAHYKPLNATQSSPKEQQEAGKQNGSSESLKDPKWPKRLEISMNQRFDANSFYIFRYEPKSHWHIIYLSLVIGAVLVGTLGILEHLMPLWTALVFRSAGAAVCLFPAWPLAVQLATWYIAVCLLTFIFGSCIIRLVLFVLFWFFGVDFWFFPNLFNEELGVIDSFKPLYSFQKRQDDWTMFAARIFLGILMAGSCYQLSQTHSLSDIHRFTTQQFLDVLDWGHQKLAAPSSTSVAAKFSPPPSTIDSKADPTEGFRCLERCGFESYDIFVEECSSDCTCMDEILRSHCFKKCPSKIQKSLEDSKEQACANEVLDDEGEAESEKAEEKVEEKTEEEAEL